MQVFLEYLDKLEPLQRERMRQVLQWVSTSFPALKPRVAWNQPMFTHHGTFIIAFSASKQHMAVSPEGAGMVKFERDIEKSGYKQSKMLFRIKWSDEVDYSLLERIILFNVADKESCKSFWRS